MRSGFEPCEGGCTCGHVRYRVLSEPPIVHCCHCSWCQRQSGSAFAVNTLIESARVEVRSGAVEELMLPSPSGRGQRIARCPKCRIAVWSNYHMGGLRDHARVVRVGTLDALGAAAGTHGAWKNQGRNGQIESEGERQ